VNGRRPPAPSVRRRMTTAQRRAFYRDACGDNAFPACNICGGWVIGQKWVESHIPVPHAWNGTETGVAHARCNAEYWAKVEAGMLAKTQREYDKDRGIHVARQPFGSREKPWKRTVDGRLVERATGAEWKSRR
jgi:hypothetical protein